MVTAFNRNTCYKTLAKPNPIKRSLKEQVQTIKDNQHLSEQEIQEKETALLLSKMIKDSGGFWR